MAIDLTQKSEISEEQKNAIAHAIAEVFLSQSFRLMSPGDYKSKLGALQSRLRDRSITGEDLHAFVLDKLSKLLGNMFESSSCSITLSD